MRAALLAVAVLLATLTPLLDRSGAAVASQPPIVTAQIGIAEGNIIQALPLGTSRRALEYRLPLLFRTAEEFGVRIDTVSVGRGFWSEDAQLQSENDLDLVASGVRENVLAFAALLGQAWEQRSVYVWFFRLDGAMVTVMVPLPGGADDIARPTFEWLIADLPDGWHVRYAGPESALFVANTGMEAEDAFRARVLRAEQRLRAAGTRTSPIQVRRAEMVTLSTDTFAEAIAGAARGKAGVR